MKHRKRCLAWLLAAALVCALVGCGQESAGNASPNSSGTNPPAAQAGEEIFQKNMHQSATMDLKVCCETEDGIYVETEGAFLYFISKETKKATILCGKPECRHEDNTCNAWFCCQSLWYSNGKLYYRNADKVIENGQVVDYGDRLYSANPDGTDHTAVQKLEFTPSGDTNPFVTKRPIFHKGVTYFPCSGVLYALPLGEDIEKAEKIWGEEIPPDDSHMGNLNRLDYDLFADGDMVYFMVNLPQSDGTYKDTLYAYDTVSKEVSQVWEVPNADTVGTWETTGVSVTQWYVLDGVLTFYLSGGDYWKTDLKTGETVKLADTHEKTQYGSAVCSDEYMALLNDHPQDSNAIASFGSPWGNTGGDTIYLYSLTGAFIKELSLQSLYDKYDTISHCAPTFLSGEDIYFLADCTVWGAYVGGMSHPEGNMVLCCINIESGEITEILTW